MISSLLLAETGRMTKNHWDYGWRFRFGADLWYKLVPFSPTGKDQKSGEGINKQNLSVCLANLKAQFFLKMLRFFPANKALFILNCMLSI